MLQMGNLSTSPGRKTDLDLGPQIGPQMSKMFYKKSMVCGTFTLQVVKLRTREKKGPAQGHIERWSLLISSPVLSPHPINKQFLAFLQINFKHFILK